MAAIIVAIMQAGALDNEALIAKVAPLLEGSGIIVDFIDPVTHKDYVLGESFPQ